ncbi:MAG: hypothetical protein M0R80_04155 [Proteobacteria bacterium]|nr:hypothetical protein [Pseudomonadota bacterium]
MMKGLLCITDGKDLIAFFQRADSDNLIDLIKQIATHNSFLNLHSSKLLDLHSINFVGFAVIAQTVINQNYYSDINPLILPQPHINLDNLGAHFNKCDINISLDISINHKGIWILKYNYGGINPIEYEEIIKLEE